ncbi:MAG: TPM domain-containing protein, partial [Chitinophagaceae bacterium]
MKQLLLILTFFIGLLQLHAQKSLPIPNPPKLVNDFAGVLSDYQVQSLENKLVAIDNNSSNQIAIASVKSLNNESIEEVANATF